MLRADTARRRLFVIHNPLSGRNRRPHLDAVCASIVTSGGHTDIASARDFASIQGLAREAAATGSYQAIVAAGGDGTIRAAASALVGTPMPLGVVPLGTGNVLATELGLPGGADAIAAMLMTGPEITVSCGLVDAEPFLLMTSAGFDAGILPRLRHRTKQLFGKLAYAGPVLAQLSQRQPTFVARIDGVDHTCSWLIVSNARHYAGTFVIAPDRAITSPGFTALVVTTTSRRDLLRVMLAIAAGRAPPASLAAVLPCRRVEIEHAAGIPIQADGDPLTLTSLMISEAKRPLKLITHAACPLAQTSLNEALNA